MNRAVAVALVVTVVLAGCAGPGGQEDEPTVEPDAGNETATLTDNDYGAEPANPPQGTGTEDVANTPPQEPTANGTGTANGAGTASGAEAANGTGTANGA